MIKRYIDWYNYYQAAYVIISFIAFMSYVVKFGIWIINYLISLF